MEAQENLPSAGWKTREVFTVAAICLALGMVMGYLLRGSAAAKAAPKPVAAQAPQAAPAQPQMPSLDDMKRMADKSAEPLLAKLRSDPNNFDLLVSVAKVYRSAHQFKTAAQYYDRALQVDSKKTATRVELASCLYYAGDVDGALKQL